MTVPFARWTVRDALAALRMANIPIEDVSEAVWPPDAPQPRTHREALTFGGPEVVDPHIVLDFETAEALEAWQLWLARYWKARPYLCIIGNILLLVSRDVSPDRAASYHAALRRLGV